MPVISTVERAFQIAQSGQCESIEALRQQLTREGYGDANAQTSFPTVRKQLGNLLRGESAALPPPKRKPRSRRPAIVGGAV